MWKHRQKKFRNYKRSEDIAESYGHKKSSKRDIIYYECKELGYFRSDCPKLQKTKAKEIFWNKERYDGQQRWFRIF